jgi:hypothetical protein
MQESGTGMVAATAGSGLWGGATLTLVASRLDLSREERER